MIFIWSSGGKREAAITFVSSFKWLRISLDCHWGPLVQLFANKIVAYLWMQTWVKISTWNFVVKPETNILAFSAFSCDIFVFSACWQWQQKFKKASKILWI